MPLWRRKTKPSQIYYLKPRSWYRRPRHKAAVYRPRRTGWTTKIRPFAERLFDNFLYRTIALIAILLAAFTIFISASFSIQNVEVTRQDLSIDSAKVENLLSGYIGKSIIFSRKQSMIKTILGRFPEFKTVRIKKILPDRIQVSLEAYPLVANLKAYHLKPKGPSLSPQQFSALNQAIQDLAQDSSAKPTPSKIAPPNEGGGQSNNLPLTKGEGGSREGGGSPSAVDSAPAKPIEQKGLLNGIGQAIFDRTDNLELMTIILHDLKEPVLDRQQIISPAQMSYLLESIAYFQSSMNLEVGSVYYFSAGREIHLKTRKGLSVWLTFEVSFKDQIDKLKAIYESAELSKQNLSYIDLRIREKVIYCPRESACHKKANE